MRYILFILLTVLTASVSGQGTYWLSGKATDNTGDPVRGAKVWVDDKDDHFRLTGDDGRFRIRMQKEEGHSIHISHAGFIEFQEEISGYLLKRIADDTLHRTFELTIVTLKPFDIVAEQKPDTAYGSPQHSISDFEFFRDGFIFLAYERNLKRGSKILYVDKDQEIISSYTVPERAKKLYRDYRGGVSVVCEYNVYRVIVRNDKIHLRPWDEDVFYTQVVPVVDTIDHYIYYSNYSPDFPAFQYYCYNRIDSSHTEICNVEDADMMELYRAEYKYLEGKDKLWAFRQEVKTGVDKEIWAGLKFFTGSIYYQPLYAPMFVVDEEIFVFDHYKDQLYIMDEKHRKRDSVNIYYHKQSGRTDWEQPLLKDEVTGKIYTIYSEGGYNYLNRIDCSKGTICYTYKLFFKYPEHIKVHNGAVYYIYRPFESAQKKFLYREKL